MESIRYPSSVTATIATTTTTTTTNPPLLMSPTAQPVSAPAKSPTPARAARVLRRRAVYVVGGSLGYANWTESTQLVDRMEDADLVMWSGGEDVSASIYREPSHPAAYSNMARDRFEMAEFKKAQALGKPCWGTCRGAQFLGVMAGTRLVQHQENPAFRHLCETYDGQSLLVTSTHHQSVYPWNLPPDQFHLLGWTNGLSSFHEDGNEQEMVNVGPGRPVALPEVEIVHFPKTKSLSCQSHPEMVYPARTPADRAMIEWMQNLLNRFLESGGMAV